MGIFKNHLTYSKFVANEIKTLGFIQSNATIKAAFPQIAAASEIFYNLYRSRNKGKAKNKKNGQNFKFCCDWPLQIEGKEKMVVIEILLEPDYSECSYQLLILEKTEEDIKLIRKFHFDFAPNVELNKKQPIYHLQYGGKPTPVMKKLEVNDTHVNSWLSLPRITSYPTNLALLLDLVFCEFQSEKTNRISETDEWRQLIKQNEVLITKQYFNRINNFFNGQQYKSTFLFRDFYYGKK